MDNIGTESKKKGSATDDLPIEVPNAHSPEAC